MCGHIIMISITLANLWLLPFLETVGMSGVECVCYLDLYDFKTSFTDGPSGVRFA